MNEDYKELAERIRGQVEDLDRAVEKALRVWAKAERVQADREVYLDSVALNLHGFYSGLERLFELIARYVDLEFPKGEMWHRILLHQMAKDVSQVRPSVISAEVAEMLDEFRRFRHLVRNVYAANLVPERMANLLEALPGLWRRLKEELLAFASFLLDFPHCSRTN